jgi:hypothetical protein
MVGAWGALAAASGRRYIYVFAIGWLGWGTGGTRHSEPCLYQYFFFVQLQRPERRYSYPLHKRQTGSTEVMLQKPDAEQKHDIFSR